MKKHCLIKNCRICKALEYWDKADNKKRHDYLMSINSLKFNKYELIEAILRTENETRNN